jgi:DNA-binding CsgD family transcriptional regulator
LFWALAEINGLKPKKLKMHLHIIIRITGINARAIQSIQIDKMGVLTY